MTEASDTWFAPDVTCATPECGHYVWEHDDGLSDCGANEWCNCTRYRRPLITYPVRTEAAR